MIPNTCSPCCGNEQNCFNFPSSPITVTGPNVFTPFANSKFFFMQVTVDGINSFSTALPRVFFDYKDNNNYRCIEFSFDNTGAFRLIQKQSGIESTVATSWAGARLVTNTRYLVTLLLCVTETYVKAAVRTIRFSFGNNNVPDELVDALAVYQPHGGNTSIGVGSGAINPGTLTFSFQQSEPQISPLQTSPVNDSCRKCVHNGACSSSTLNYAYLRFDVAGVINGTCGDCLGINKSWYGVFMPFNNAYTSDHGNIHIAGSGNASTCNDVFMVSGNIDAYFSAGFSVGLDFHNRLYNVNGRSWSLSQQFSKLDCASLQAGIFLTSNATAACQAGTCFMRGV